MNNMRVGFNNIDNTKFKSTPPREVRFKANTPRLYPHLETIYNMRPQATQEWVKKTGSKNLMDFAVKAHEMGLRIDDLKKIIKRLQTEGWNNGKIIKKNKNGNNVEVANEKNPIKPIKKYDKYRKMID